MTYRIQVYDPRNTTWRDTDDAPTGSYSSALNEAVAKYGDRKWRIIDDERGNKVIASNFVARKEDA